MGTNLWLLVANGGVGAIGGDNFGLSGSATGGTGDGIAGDAGGASACFDVDACLTGEGGIGGGSTGGNGNDAGANIGGFADGAPGGTAGTGGDGIGSDGGSVKLAAKVQRRRRRQRN